MRRLLVVHHAPGSALPELLDAVLRGARHPEIEGVEVEAREALAASAEDVLRADGLLLLTPANFGTMSGALKHFFDRTFLEIGGSLDPYGGADASTPGATAGRPFGLLVHGSYDTTGAVRAVQAITGALGWRLASAVREVRGSVTEEHRADAEELGATLAAVVATSRG